MMDAVATQFYLLAPRHGPMPKVDFPKFSGDNPRLWKDCAEIYFEVYAISDALKTRFAALNFEGAASTWLESVELCGRITSWPALCAAVFDQFDRDQYPIYLKQFDSLQQSGTVTKYFDQFQRLAHQILLYNNSYDDVYFVTHFLGGLRDNIRAPLVLQRPKDLVTACSLALIQESELQNGKARGWKTDHKLFKPANNTDKFRTPFKRVEIQQLPKAVADDKWSALKSYRKANGLCFTCGEEWQGRNHKCLDQVSINMVQELMDMFQLNTEYDSDGDDTEPEPEQVVLAVQAPSSSGIAAPKKRKTMRFRGFIGKQEILILLDSGSMSTSIREDLANSLNQNAQPCESLKYTAANGTTMLSDTVMPQLHWFIQGHSFTYDARIISLSGFDMILGADWLEDHSPMWVHWKKKLLTLPHKGRRIKLKGLHHHVAKCVQISPHKLKGLLKKKAITHCVQLKPVQLHSEPCSVLQAVTDQG